MSKIKNRSWAWIFTPDVIQKKKEKKSKRSNVKNFKPNSYGIEFHAHGTEEIDNIKEWINVVLHDVQ